MDASIASHKNKFIFESLQKMCTELITIDIKITIKEI